tara:strand:+ start:217 stop:570 length:354 start_codon:yes stop_codon:yes gene_type:complete
MNSLLNTYCHVNDQVNRHTDLIDAPIAVPDFAEFKNQFAETGEFTTPVGTIDATHLMEDIVFSYRQPVFDAIQMEALKFNAKTTTVEQAAKNWLMLAALMNAAAVDFYNKKIVEDYL